MAESSSLTWWAVTIGIVVALLTLDFIIAARKPHHVGMREATIWSVFYIVVALVFGLFVIWLHGGQAGTEYYAGYIVEKSLSVDNLFVFLIIMTKFSVPDVLQQRVLLFGIAAALVLRAIFILIGAAALSLFSFMFLVFGLFLIYTAVQLARHRNEEPDADNALVRWVQKVLPTTDEYHGTALTIKENGKRVVTPLLIVFVAIAGTDVLFALDSIPAVFGITRDPFIVFATNAFALLGLRALYFLIHGLLDKLVFLSIGLSIILGFIGVKLIITWIHEDINAAVPHVPTGISLSVILGILVITTVASLVYSKRHPEATPDVELSDVEGEALRED